VKKVGEAEEVATTVSTRLGLDTPLLNFIFFLVKTIKSGAGPLFQILRQKYSVAISRDPSFDKVSDDVRPV
jgi:hypothetical protein